MKIPIKGLIPYVLFLAGLASTGSIGWLIAAMVWYVVIELVLS